MTDAPIEVRLRVPEGEQPVGSCPAVSVEVRNRSDRPIWFVGVLDGSETRTRYPHYLPRISRNGVVVYIPPTAEDPLVSPLRVADFRLLQPGEVFDPTRSEGGAAWLPLSTFATFCPSAPGQYELELVVSTESRTPEEWLGRFNQAAEAEAVQAKVELVPRLTVHSNLVRLHVG
jgi:hypothetical protein